MNRGIVPILALSFREGVTRSRISTIGVELSVQTGGHRDRENLSAGNGRQLQRHSSHPCIPAPSGLPAAEARQSAAHGSDAAPLTPGPPLR
jgi:hypothetical protein